MLEKIMDCYPDETFLKADGFDDCVIGVEEGSERRLIYSVTKCIQSLIDGGMDEEDGFEYFYYNVAGSYMGAQTPIFMEDDFSDE